MAVVQISRIQIRRGKANTGDGIPQLASGEFAWAIDSQELFIGNGAIQEGAPYVGNTKLLTENDNILELASLYQYKRNDLNIVTGANDYVQRSLQDRLDDYVSVRSFGAIGDGVVDDTAAIQRAIDQLFINDNTKNDPRSRTILNFDAGRYIISDELRIPPYAHLIGAGTESTIILQTSNNAIMRTVDGLSRPGSYTSIGNMTYSARPRDIYVSGMSLQTQASRSIIFLDNAHSTLFESCRFLGTYVNGTTPVSTVLPGAFTDRQSAVFMRSNSAVFSVRACSFQNCRFTSTGYGFYSESESDRMTIKNSILSQLFIGVKIGGGTIGAINSIIDQTYFDQIDQYAIWITAGSDSRSSYGNASTNNKFYVVGNNNNSYANPQYGIIRFDTKNNTSKGDYFERNSRLKSQLQYGLNAFKPNVLTSDLIYDDTSYLVNIIETGSTPIPAIRFPIITSATYEIDYVMNKFSSGKSIRTGVLHITVNVEEPLNGISITTSSCSTTYFNVPSTVNIPVGTPIVFSGTPFGGITTFSHTYYVISAHFTSTTFSISNSLGGSIVNLTSGSGSMTIYRAGGANPPSYHIHDDFGYTGDVSVENIRFIVALQGLAPQTTNADTMVISYTNPTGNGISTMNYTYRMLTK